MLKTASSNSESVLSLVLKVLGKFLPHNQILNFQLTRLQVWTKLEASENSEDISVLFFNFRFLPNPRARPTGRNMHVYNRKIRIHTCLLTNQSPLFASIYRSTC